jgi:hypothetical protein
VEHDLSISSSYTDPDGNKVRGRITVVRALTHLGKLPLYPYPQSFQGRFLGVLSDGKLVGLAQGQLDHFKFGQEVRAEFIGKTYKFRRLESDGTFEVSMGW